MNGFKKTFPWTAYALSKKINDTGRVSSKQLENEKIIDNANIEVSELYDAFCVAAEFKPLSMSIHNLNRWRTMRKRQPAYAHQQITRANLAEDILEKMGVKCLYHKKTKGYNSIYFRKGNESNALKLMAFITSNEKIHHFDEHSFQYAIGKLLGYSKDNISYFLLTRFDEFKITEEFITETDKLLEELNVSIDDFNPKEVSILDKHHTIPLETRKYTKKQNK